MKKFILIFMSCFLSGIVVKAQTDTTKISGNIAIGGNITGGNYSSYTLYLKSELNKQWIKDNKQLSWMPNFQYSKLTTNGISQVREREAYSLFNYTKKWQHWKFMLSNESEYSYLRKVDFRGSLGVGFAYRFLRGEINQLDISEIILPEVMVSNSGNQYDNLSTRISTRIKYIYNDKKIKISSITLIQPPVYTQQRHGEFVEFKDNLNLRSNNTAEVMIRKSTTIGIGNEVIYQSYNTYINNNIKPLDYSFYFFIKFQN